MIKERDGSLNLLTEPDLSRAPLDLPEEPKPAKRRPVPAWLPLVILFLEALALYLCTRTHLNTFDAVSYASLMAIHRNAPGSSVAWMFHPHHLLFNAVGYFCYKTALGLGYTGNSLSVMQIVNSFLGALGLAIFYSALRRILPREEGLALLIALAFGCSFGYWICATDGRVNMPSLILLLAAFHTLVRLLDHPNKGLAATMGLFAGGAVLFHESAGLFFFAGLLGVVLATRSKEPGKKGRGLALPAVYLASYMAIVALPYLLIGYCLIGLHSPAAFKHWASSYAELGWWWNFNIPYGLHQDLYAVRHALFVEPSGAGTIHLSPTVPAWLRALYWTALAGWVIASLFLVTSLPRLFRSGRSALVSVCLLWTVLYAVFFTIWSPGYFVFWAPVLAPVAVLLALAIHALPRRREGPASAALALWIALFIAINWICSIRPNMAAAASPFQRIALDVRAHTSPGDLIVVMGAGNDAQCEVDIPYFAERNLLSLHSTLTSAHEDAPLSLQRAQAQIARTLGLNHQVYALDEVLNSRPAFAALQKKHPSFSAGDLQSLMGAYRWTPAWTGPRGVVWRLVGKPNPPAPLVSIL